jgi:hypothetical protein
VSCPSALYVVNVARLVGPDCGRDRHGSAKTKNEVSKVLTGWKSERVKSESDEIDG